MEICRVICNFSCLAGIIFLSIYSVWFYVVVKIKRKRDENFLNIHLVL